MVFRGGVFFLLGARGRHNWVYYRPPINEEVEVKTMTTGTENIFVFFPGDISDFPKENGFPYSLDGLAWIMAQRVPEYHFVMVRPTRLVDRYAMYLNFAMVDATGCPRPAGQVPSDWQRDSE
eukprot:Selendium_serpulae@DN6337_c2_g3_i5.p1